MTRRGIPNIYEVIKNPEEYISGYPLHSWYRGIVEDVNDPEKRGRVRVRVESVYRKQQGTTTDDVGDSVKTEELPWADIVCHGQSNKVGCFGVPQVNDAVIVVFEYGRPEYPLVIGGWWGEYTDEANKKTEPEVPLAALGGDQEGETGNDKKGNDTGVSGVDGVTLDEPPNPYGATYPNNQVLRTSSGHLLELDNTEGAERINIVHTSGTWAEFHPDGTLVFGIQGKRYTLVEQDDDQHVKGNRNIVVDGDATRRVKGDLIEEFDKDISSKVTGNLTEEVTGDLSSKAKSQTIETTGGEALIKSSTTAKLQATGGSTTVQSNIKVVASAPIIEFTGVTPAPATGGGEVVTTLTHPVDYITGIPILGVSGFKVL